MSNWIELNWIEFNCVADLCWVDLIWFELNEKWLYLFWFNFNFNLILFDKNWHNWFRPFHTARAQDLGFRIITLWGGKYVNFYRTTQKLRTRVLEKQGHISRSRVLSFWVLEIFKFQEPRTHAVRDGLWWRNLSILFDWNVQFSLPSFMISTLIITSGMSVKVIQLIQ